MKNGFGTVTNLFLFHLTIFNVLSNVMTNTIKMMLNVYTIKSRGGLRVLVRTTTHPGQVPLVTISLIRHLPSNRPTPLRFRVGRQGTISRGHRVVTIVVPYTIYLFCLVLISSLRTIIVSILLISRHSIFKTTVVPIRCLRVIFLGLPNLFKGILIKINGCVARGLLPLHVKGLMIIRLFRLTTRIDGRFVLNVRQRVNMTLLTRRPSGFFLRFYLALMTIETRLKKFVNNGGDVFINDHGSVRGKRFGFLLRWCLFFILHFLFAHCAGWGFCFLVPRL